MFQIKVHLCLNIPKLGVHLMGTPPTPNTTAVRIQSPFSTEIPERRFMLRLLALRESTRMLHPFLGAPKSLHRRLEVGLGLGLVRRLRLSPPKGLVNMIFFVSEKKWTNPGILTLDVIGSLVCFIWFWMVVFAGNSCCDIRWNRKRFCSVGFFYWTNIER